MTSPPHACRQPESRLRTLINWLALAVLVALGIFAAPARASESAPARRPAQKALSPVSVRPMVSWWIVSVPS
jgi:hypothetical protein